MKVRLSSPSHPPAPKELLLLSERDRRTEDHHSFFLWYRSSTLADSRAHRAARQGVAAQHRLGLRVDPRTHDLEHGRLGPTSLCRQLDGKVSLW